MRRSWWGTLGRTAAASCCLAVVACPDAKVQQAASHKQQNPFGPRIFVDYGPTHDVYPSHLAPKTIGSLATSVGILRPRVDADTSLNFKNTPLLAFDGVEVCAGTPYLGDQTLGTASATAAVIGRDLILTAKHYVCAKSDTEARCKAGFPPRELRITFGWAYNEDSSVPSTFSEEDDYVLERICTAGDGSALSDDWAILQVEEAFSASHPSISRFRQPVVGEPVVTLAHPFGTPLRYAECGIITSISGGAVRTTLDATHGFSGAPLIAFSAEGPYLVGVHSGSYPWQTAGLDVVQVCASRRPDVESKNAPTQLREVDGCCATHGKPWNAEKCGRSTKQCAEMDAVVACCDDFRPRLQFQPQLRPAEVGKCDSNAALPPPVDLGRRCVTLPMCRESGCCNQTYDSDGVAYGGVLASHLDAIRNDSFRCQ